MATSNISYISHNLDSVASIRLISDSTTTGSTGNISANYPNDGKTVIFGAYASGANVLITPFVSGQNGDWYLKVRDADSNATVNNTQIAYRFYVMKMK